MSYATAKNVVWPHLLLDSQSIAIGWMYTKVFAPTARFRVTPPAAKGIDGPKGWLSDAPIATLAGGAVVYSCSYIFIIKSSLAVYTSDFDLTVPTPNTLLLIQSTCIN